jgi:methionine synthase I (cobalamin-dependent)
MSSSQTVSVDLHSLRSVQPLAVGVNCAVGAALMRPCLGEFARDGLVDLVGGSCGMTTEPIAAAAAAISTYRPRSVHDSR